MRAAVIVGPVIPEQLSLWSAVEDEGVRVTVIGTDHDVYRGRFPWHPRKPTDLDSCILRLVSPAPRRGQVWWTYAGLTTALRRARPDVVHVVSEPWGALVLQTLWARASMRIPLPVCVHGADNIFEHGGRGERAARRLILDRVWPRIDGFASWSSEGIGAARAAGLPRVPTAVVPAIVPDPASFADRDRAGARERFALPRDEPVVGYVGRLDPEKGVEDLLRAMEALGPSGPFLSVWGSGRLEGLVRRTLGSRRVRGSFGGPLGLAEVPDALAACDVVAVPSRTTPSWKEQFGRVIVEAMLAEAAVVGYRSGAIPEAAGDAAVLIREGDVPALASAIRDLAEDERRRTELAAKGKQRALSRFHPRVLANELARFWSEVA